MQNGVESLYCKCTLVKYIHLIISAQQLQKSYMPILNQNLGFLAGWTLFEGRKSCC